MGRPVRPYGRHAVAADLARARKRPMRSPPRSRVHPTCALRFTKPLLDNSGYRGLRRVVDVSSDGTNNNGPLLTPMHDEVISAGITINGLPIKLKRANAGNMDIEEIDTLTKKACSAPPTLSRCRSASAQNSSKHRLTNWCLRLPAVSRSRASFRRAPRNR
jgi:hypothetical protein